MPSLARPLSNAALLLFIFGYMLYMLATECMPVADTDRVVHAIPRWEFWLIQASFPDILWMQWTGGGLPLSIADRFPILFGATSWLALSMLLGRLILRLDGIDSWFRGWLKNLFATIIGHALLSTMVFLHGISFGTQSPWTLIASVMATLGWAFWRTKRAPPPSPLHATAPDLSRHTIATPAQPYSDASFQFAWSRRLLGLFSVAITWLVLLVTFAAPLPTNDVFVREVEMMAIKEYHRSGSIIALPNHAQSNEPKSMSMSASAMATLLVGPIDADEPWPAEQTDRMFVAIAIGKTVNAILPLIAALLVGIASITRWGTLAGLFTTFVMVATPGMIELGRLGRTEALCPVWAVAFCALSQSPKWRLLPISDNGQTNTNSGWLSSIILLNAAVSTSYASAVVVGIPCMVAISLRLYRQLKFRTESREVSTETVASKRSNVLNNRTRLATSALSIIALSYVFSWYLFNAVELGDPAYPWISLCFTEERPNVTHADVPSSNAQSAPFINSIHRRAWWANQFETVEHPAHESNSHSTEASLNASDQVADTRPETEKATFARTLDALCRFLFRSNAHGLLLIPLSLIGLHRRCREGHGFVAAWVFYWLALWLVASPQMDRDWVGLLMLIAWFAPAGVESLQSRFGGWAIGPLALIAIVWSSISIAVWPMCDNRIFVSLKTLRTPFHQLDDSPRYQAYVNQTLRDNLNSQNDENNVGKSFVGGRVLLVGDCDTTELNAIALSNGTYDHGLWDIFRNKSSSEIRDLLKAYDVSNVIISWSGIHGREAQIHVELAKEYRSTLSRLVNDKVIEPKSWPLLSSDAELFVVNGSRTTDIIDSPSKIR